MNLVEIKKDSENKSNSHNDDYDIRKKILNVTSIIINKIKKTVNSVKIFINLFIYFYMMLINVILFLQWQQSNCKIFAKTNK